MTKLRLALSQYPITAPTSLEAFAAKRKSVRIIYADYDLTFPRALSLDVIKGLRDYNIDYDYKVLPCGHYTTGETPFKYMDGWWLGAYVYNAFKKLRSQPPAKVEATRMTEAEEAAELVQR